MLRDVQDLLDTVDARPTVAAYASAARKVHKLRAELKHLRVSLLASYTVDAVVPYMEVEASRYGFAVDTYCAPFNSVLPELLSPESGCLSHVPDVVFVLHLLEDVCPALAGG